MSKKILIDAAHLEETRIVVTKDGFIDEFDFQTQKKQTKGNIYLAKVARVEPSLQAAFIEYGSQKHGFLPFAEIHPDYYQIPKSDRDALLEELSLARKSSKAHKKEEQGTPNPEDGEVVTESISEYEDEDYSEPQFYKRYKIQEVIKKDQIVLIQIEKEERGNKGAALTTYMSLAGRYCVLMPNATKGGGVSRKIDDQNDRDRLKKISFDLTESLGNQGAVIIRTAGSYKTKTEIKRDLSYLQKLWDNIRDHTMNSKAPAFIHEEGDIVKRAVRDSYDQDVEEILIEGNQAYEDAKHFISLLLPKHTNKVKAYKGDKPIFAKFKIEPQLAALFSSQVKLRSGGYLVINQTEALVSIDVNSGRATSERNIENTAVKTNIEAAEEIAKQIRLRDLSGLVVIDFIDMEELKNRKAVERSFKDALANDRARIQLGRISNFGLLEMSRQRLRQNFVEAHTDICTHCNGKGRVRPTSSTSLAILRAIEAEVAPNSSDGVVVSGSAALMFYILNKKRSELVALEKKLDTVISFSIDEEAGGDGFFLDIKPKTSHADELSARPLSSVTSIEASDEVEEEEEEVIIIPETPRQETISEVSGEPRPRNNRFRHGDRRFKGKGGRRNDDRQPQPQPRPEDAVQSAPEPAQPESFETELTEPKGKRKIQHKRGRFSRPPSDQKPSHLPREPQPNMSAEVNYDEAEMAVRRKQNQSLLKEIWKKIVD